MQFEWYEPEGPRRTARPTVTVQKDKTLSLNRAAWEALGEPKHVRLGFDKADRLVAIQPVDERHGQAKAQSGGKAMAARTRRAAAVGYLTPYTPKAIHECWIYGPLARRCAEGPSGWSPAKSPTRIKEEKRLMT
jgi:hypothetical protein